MNWNLVMIVFIFAGLLAKVDCEGHQLTYGAAKQIFLKGAEEQTFTSSVLVHHSPIWMVISPCGSAITWTLSSLSAAAANTDVKTDQYNLVPDTSQIKSRHDNLAHNNTKSQLRPRTSHLLTITSKKRMQHFADHFERGTELTIRVSAPNASPNEYTAVMIFITSDEHQMFQYLPRLPDSVHDQQLQASTQNSSILLSWAPSPSVRPSEGLTEYCVVLHTKQHSGPFCALLGHAADDGDGNSQGMKCVGHATQLRLNGLMAGLRYFARLFVVDWHQPGASVAYETAVFVGPNRVRTNHHHKGDEEHFMLFENTVHAGRLPNRGAKQHITFKVDAYASEMLLVLHPCNGFIRVRITNEQGELLKRLESFSDLRRVFLHRLMPATLHIIVEHDDQAHEIIFMLWLSSKPSKDPYPMLPPDTSIKHLQHSRSCEHLTLAWLPSRGPVRYCLYVRPEPDAYYKQLIYQQPNQCSAQNAQSQKVFCGAEERVDSALTSPILHHVTSLIPGVSYRFDLYVEYANRPGRQTLNYRTLWVKTRHDCQPKTQVQLDL